MVPKRFIGHSLFLHLLKKKLVIPFWFKLRWVSVCSQQAEDSEVGHELLEVLCEDVCI